MAIARAKQSSSQPAPAVATGCVITPRARRWLQTTHRARILHLFPDVCNLVNERGDVLALVSPRIGPGPFSLLLQRPLSPLNDHRAPAVVDAQTQTLSVGSLLVTADQATTWHPRPPWSRLRGVAPARLPPPRPLPAAIAAPLKQLLRGLAADDATRCQAAVGALAGRGPGLTPTGDDVLLGVLYALWAWRPRPGRRPQPVWISERGAPIMKVLVDTAAARTTTLSAAFLRAAAAGEATAVWHRLVNGRSDRERAAAVDQILSIGHTSGADAWAGFVQCGKVLADL